MTPSRPTYSPATVTASLAVKVPFGKYSGRTLAFILANNPAYLNFLITCDLVAPDLRRALYAVYEANSARINDAVDEEAQHI